jgi:anti-sigma B factor antagonist
MADLHLDEITAAEDRAVLRVGGEIDLNTAPQLRERIRDLALKGAVHQIVDLGGVDYLDSTALGVLVGGLKRLRAHEGSMMLVIGAERILRIFRITGLTKVFPLYSTVAAALAADEHWREAVEKEAGSIERWCARHGVE